MKQIADALQAQQKCVSSSKEESERIIDALGMRHLLVPQRTVASPHPASLRKLTPNKKAKTRKSISKKRLHK
ncbi:hypothetical protein [Chitinophaga defluvii]|uniref:Uncharacterized protein n=1 Tax=Chitinophaga defluvii TaxID=3163343 RepID=A0ABV2TBP5_9BACT